MYQTKKTEIKFHWRWTTFSNVFLFRLLFFWNFELVSRSHFMSMNCRIPHFIIALSYFKHLCGMRSLERLTFYWVDQFRSLNSKTSKNVWTAICTLISFTAFKCKKNHRKRRDVMPFNIWKVEYVRILRERKSLNPFYTLKYSRLN